MKINIEIEDLIEMKKLFLFLLASMMLISCANFDVVSEINTDKELPSTEVFVQGLALSAKPMTKASNWPSNHSSEGWEAARFSIRADGTIPDYTDKSSTLYYGRFKNGHNIGKVYTLYPYGHYNDRHLDYYKVDKKTGENIGLFRYVYDTKGLKTQLAIKEKPSVMAILDDEIEDLTNAINKGQNVTKNTQTLADVNALKALGEEYLNKHVLWYVVKEVGMQYGWHVNGVIVDYEVEDYTIDPDKIPDNVEVDIHQQEHEDWDEIKTSVHIRTDVESVEINIPLKYEYILEQDDFVVRIFDYNYIDYSIATTIYHGSDGITINISNIPASLIQELKEKYGDGLTIEIHSYCTKSDYWDELKKSCVIKTGKPCTVNGQVSSAFHPGEVVPIYIR